MLGLDPLTTLTLNYEWRQFVISQLDNIMESALRYAPDSEKDDLESAFLAMFLDFYD